MKFPHFLQSLSKIGDLVSSRIKRIGKSSEAIPEDHTTAQARLLHSGPTKATLVARREESCNAYRLSFEVGHPVYFQPGTYLTIRLHIGDSYVTRPYSIASSLEEGKQGHVDIIVRDDPNGFVAPYLCHEIPVPSQVTLEVGLGHFYVDPFRDAGNIVCIAGGVGIAPFLSMASSLNVESITILRGAKSQSELIGGDAIEALNKPNVRVIDVLSEEEVEGCEHGFIDAKLIKKYSTDGDCSYFLCGPAAMEAFVRKQLASMGVPARRIRSECFSSPKVYDRPDFPEEAKGKTYRLSVIQGIKKTVIDAYSGESLVTALERAGLYVRTCCRSGACGACRMKVLEGDVYVIKENDGRRAADKEFGYVHGCNAYPLGDVAVRINIPPTQE